MTETKFNILVLGGGGREHALCWKIAGSPHCARLFCAPGNGGTAAVAENIHLDEKDHDAVFEKVFSISGLHEKNAGMVFAGKKVIRDSMG